MAPFNRARIIDTLLKTVYFFLIVLQIITCLPVLLCALWWSFVVVIALGMSAPKTGDAVAMKGAWWEVLLVFIQTPTLLTILTLNLLRLYDALDNPPNRRSTSKSPSIALAASKKYLKQEAIKSGLATLEYGLIVAVPILPVLRSVSMARLCWGPVVFIFYPTLALSLTFHYRATLAQKKDLPTSIYLPDSEADLEADAGSDVHAERGRGQDSDTYEEEEGVDFWTLNDDDLDGDVDVDGEAGIPLMVMKKKSVDVDANADANTVA